MVNPDHVLPSKLKIDPIRNIANDYVAMLKSRQAEEPPESPNSSLTSMESTLLSSAAAKISLTAGKESLIPRHPQLDHRPGLLHAADPKKEIPSPSWSRLLPKPLLVDDPWQLADDPRQLADNPQQDHQSVKPPPGNLILKIDPDHPLPNGSQPTRYNDDGTFEESLHDDSSSLSKELSQESSQSNNMSDFQSSVSESNNNRASWKGKATANCQSSVSESDNDRASRKGKATAKGKRKPPQKRATTKVTHGRPRSQTKLKSALNVKKPKKKTNRERIEEIVSTVNERYKDQPRAPLMTSATPKRDDRTQILIPGQRFHLSCSYCRTVIIDQSKISRHQIHITRVPSAGGTFNSRQETNSIPPRVLINQVIKIGLMNGVLPPPQFRSVPLLRKPNASNSPAQPNVAPTYGYQSNVAPSYGYPTDNPANTFQSNSTPAFNGYKPLLTHFDHTPQRFETAGATGSQKQGASSGPKPFNYSQYWNPVTQSYLTLTQPSNQAPISAPPKDSSCTFNFSCPSSNQETAPAPTQEKRLPPPPPSRLGQSVLAPHPSLIAAPPPSSQFSAPTPQFAGLSPAPPPLSSQFGQSVTTAQCSLFAQSAAPPVQPPISSQFGQSASTAQPKPSLYAHSAAPPPPPPSCQFGQSAPAAQPSHFGHFSQPSQFSMNSQLSLSGQSSLLTATPFKPTIAQPTTNNPFMPPSASTSFWDPKAIPPPQVSLGIQSRPGPSPVCHKDKGDSFSPATATQPRPSFSCASAASLG
ncbi:hypothetical protein PtB15_1B661 [Puccinia triticina]|nr:hypothetical protein PtB15_1B661 [Puccinia triticina]